MTNRVDGLVITLDKDYRDDDVEVIVNAIKMIKGVANVEMNVVELKDYLYRSRVRWEVESKLIQAVRDIFGDED